MAKKLYILRHAQALSAADGTDINRKLSPKGCEDAAALGRAMVQKGYLPDFIAVSPAIRTVETHDHVMQALPEVGNISPDNLYNGTAGDLVNCIQNTADEYESLLLIAHNPGVHELVVWLNQPEADAHLHRLGGYDPATLCVLECPCASWADIQPRENTLIDVMETIDYNAPARPTRWM